MTEMIPMMLAQVLPQTGEASPWLIYGVGAVAIIAGIALIASRRKK